MIKELLSNIVFKNFSFLTIGSTLGQLIGIFVVLRITASVSPDDYGLYTFLISQGLLLVKIGNLGNNNIIIRTIARNPRSSKDYLTNVSLLRFLTILGLTVFYMVYNCIFGSLNSEQIVLIFLFSLFNCISYLFEFVFTGNQKILPISVINLIYNLLWFTIVFLIPIEKISATTLFALYVVTNFIRCCIFYVVLVKKALIIGNTRRFFESVGSLMKESWPYLAMILIMLPLTSLTNNFLDLNSTNDEIGYFNLAQRFIGPVGLVITMMLTALFPNLAILWEKNPNRFRTNVAKGFRLYMLISAFGCFAFTIFSEDLIKAIFKKEYYNAILVCQIQVWYVFLTSVDSLIGAILGATNKEKLILRFGIIYFFICTPSLFYGSFYGAQGLSWSYVISFGIGLIYAWIVFQRKLALRIEKELETITLVFLFAILSYLSVNIFGMFQKIALFLFVLILFSMYSISIFKKMKLT